MHTQNRRNPTDRNRKQRASISCQLSIDRFREESEAFRIKTTKASKPTTEPSETSSVLTPSRPDASTAEAVALTATASGLVNENSATINQVANGVSPSNASEVPTKSKAEKLSALKHEILVVGILILILAALSALGGYGAYDPSKVIKISDYEFSLDLLKWSSITGIAIIPLFLLGSFALNPSGEKPVFHRTLHVISWLFFTICGLVAHMVLTTLIGQYLRLSPFLAHPISMFLVLIYEYLILKLYAYGAIESHFILWEIFRFALVGVVAALADFLCTSATRAALNTTGLINSGSGDIAITAIAVTVGFVVGVIINYILSVYMVYKSTTKSTSKRWWGILLFVALSAVGLGIGMGIEMWLYDNVGLAYIVVFIIRTLVVLVWNYVSRKLILFR